MRLLILSCSQKKSRAGGLIPALDRYDGTFFQVLKKALRDGHGEDLQVVILSGKFGLLGVNTAIPNYDQRITPDQCRKLRPIIQRPLKVWLADNPTEIFVNLGRDYLPLVEGLPELAHAIWAKGQIGERARALKEWLRQKD